MNKKIFRTVEDIIEFIEKCGYTYNRSSGSHHIYSKLGHDNILLVWHNKPKTTRLHPKEIKRILYQCKVAS